MNYKLGHLYLFLAQFVLCTISYSQGKYNFVERYDDNITRNEILYESEEAYYTIGYSDDNSNTTVGIHVSQHDKINGEVLENSYFAIEGEWSFLENSFDVYEKDNSLIFGLTGDGGLYKLAYNLTTAEIDIIDSVFFPIDDPGLSQYDMLIYNDTTLYVVAYSLEVDSSNLGLIFTYPNGTQEFKLLPKTDSLQSLGRMMKRENGNYMLFSSLKGQNVFWDRSLAFFELDKELNVLNSFYTTNTDGYITPKSILPINNQEVLVLAAFYDWDYIRDRYAYSHQILRYHIDNREIVWSYNYGSPASNGLSGGKIVASHQADHYLYCTEAVREDATIDSFNTVGRVVKINAEGEKSWRKDYSYFSNHNDDHNLYDIIATSDNNYLIGGRASSNKTYGWLLKINESGELLGDSLVNVTWNDNDWTKDIQIYPNPTIDHIYINQNNLDQVTYQLVDVNGKLLKEVNINAKDQGVIWNVSDLISSSYFIRMIRDGKVIGSTVIVKQE